MGHEAENDSLWSHCVAGKGRALSRAVARGRSGGRAVCRTFVVEAGLLSRLLRVPVVLLPASLYPAARSAREGGGRVQQQTAADAVVDDTSTTHPLQVSPLMTFVSTCASGKCRNEAHCVTGRALALNGTQALALPFNAV